MQLSAAEEASRAAGGLPFQIRGSLQTLLTLKLLRPDDPAFFTALVEKVAHAPDFFRDAPLVLDGAAVKAKAPDCLAEIVQRLKEHRVVPVGLRNGSPAWNEAATALGLALFGAGSDEPKATAGRGAGQQEPRTAPAGLVVHQPVRGGQQVVAEGDLVVMAPVSAGAEVAAAGHIHLYAPLRGRAFAGMNGDESAMIFCEQLDAELLSIAGVHLVNEELDSRLIGRRVRVSLAGEKLQVVPLP